jgi:hypothetical protein
MSKPRPIAVSDDQLSQIMAALEPLQPGERSAVLAKLADHLRAMPEVGDGALFRLLKELVRQVWRPPASTSGPQSHRNVGPPLE